LRADQDLARLIDEAQKAGFPDAFPNYVVEWKRHLDISELPDAVQRLLEHFERPEYDFAQERMFHVGSGAVRVSPPLLVNWTITRASDVGAERAAEEIAAYLEVDYNAAFSITAITGLSTNCRRQLTDETWIVPFSEVPAGQQKESLRPDEATIGSLLSLPDGIDFVRKSLEGAPESALVSDIQIRPRYSEPEDDTLATDGSRGYEHEVILALAMLCCDEVAPVGIRKWRQLKPEVPLSGALGTAYQYPVEQVVPRRSETIDEHALDTLQHMLTQYGALREKDQRRIKVACDRLTQCINRMHEVQRAIDLGIAVESVIVPSDAPAQLSYQFRVVGAWLSGETFEERNQNYSVLRSIYDMRSEAVHNGVFSKNQRRLADGSTLPNAKMIEKGILIAKKCLRRVLERGGLSDEDARKLVLGESVI